MRDQRRDHYAAGLPRPRAREHQHRGLWRRRHPLTLGARREIRAATGPQRTLAHARRRERLRRMALGLQALVRADERIEQLQDERDTQHDHHHREAHDRAGEQQHEQHSHLPAVAL